jgi:hypothetical protein
MYLSLYTSAFPTDFSRLGNTVSVIGERMHMGHWWNETDSRNQKYLATNLYQYHWTHVKIQNAFPVIEADPQRSEANDRPPEPCLIRRSSILVLTVSFNLIYFVFQFIPLSQSDV